MAELDLTNPEHLAQVLQASLPDFDDETPESVAPHIEALERSDADHFGHIGVGARDSDDEPVEQDGPEQVPPPVKGQDGPEQVPPPMKGQGPEQHGPEQGPPPLDMGGEGLLLEDVPLEATEIALPGGVHANRGWTELQRNQSRGRHAIYTLQAKHSRSKPIESVFTGRCQSVRATLPVNPAGTDAFIGTWIGTVEARDHLAFSILEVLDLYEREFTVRPVVGRVDLITGARFRGRRFSPVSIYLAYPSTSPTAKPLFYMLEGGSAAGQPKAMYFARTMGDECKATADFSFTPFACAKNWYEGGMSMDPSNADPACVYLTIAQTRDGRHEYMKLVVDYERDQRMRRVIHPFELQVEAAIRVMAIADEAGYQLESGKGGVLQHSLGPLARALLAWDERPNGSTTPQERKQFCGCPEN